MPMDLVRGRQSSPRPFRVKLAPLRLSAAQRPNHFCRPHRYFGYDGEIVTVRFGSRAPHANWRPERSGPCSCGASAHTGATLGAQTID